MAGPVVWSGCLDSLHRWWTFQWNPGDSENERMSTRKIGQPSKGEDRRIVLPSTIFSGDMFIFAGGSWLWLQFLFNLGCGDHLSWVFQHIPSYFQSSKWGIIGKPYRTPSRCARTRLVGMRIIILHFPQQNSLGPHPLKTTTAAGTAKRHPWRLSHGFSGLKKWVGTFENPTSFFFPPHGFSLCLPLFFVGCQVIFFFSGAGIFD